MRVGSSETLLVGGSSSQAASHPQGAALKAVMTAIGTSIF
jgi:hypothetical protein